MVDCQGVNLNSNWGTLGDVGLSSILYGGNPDNTEICLDQVTTDKCVCLVRKDSTETAKPHIEIKVNGSITNITLISEAQIIEVFGVNDEYLLTHTSEFFDDWEGMAVYHSQIPIPNIPVCKLKFTRTRNGDRVWIYAAKINVRRKVNHHSEYPINFNLDQISRLLGNSNLTNINSGNNLKSLLQFYFKNLPNNNLGYLLGKKPVPNDVHSNSSSSGNNCSKEESGVMEMLSKLQINVPEMQKTCPKPMTTDSDPNSWLVNYIDKKFSEMKTEIMHEIDAKINSLREENNQKLDKIISILELQQATT